MKLGFVSAILPELSLDEVAAFASTESLACVELMCWPPGKAERRYAGVTHVDVTDLSAGEAQDLLGRVGSMGVEISALGYYPNPLSGNQEEASIAVDHLRKVISAAATLQLSTVNTFVGRNPAASPEENWARFGKVWPDLIRHAEAAGIRIGIENCPMFFSNDEWPGGKNLAVSPAAWRRMFHEIPSHCFGLNYDPSHLVWQQMDEIRPIREFAEKLFHVHAKDVRVDRERLNNVGILATPLEYHAPKLPGLGDVRWGAFFSALTDAGYDGPVCIEVEDRPYEKDLASRKEAVRQSARFLRNFMPLA